MSASRIDLTTGPITPHLVRMTVPMIWGIAAMVSLQLVDTFYISLLGTRELAAISFTFPVTMAVFSIIMGFGIAMSSVVSRLIGERREDDVRRVTTHGILLVFVIGCALALLGMLTGDAIFAAMGADDSMRPLIHDYMHIWFLGTAFIATPFVGNSAIRASGSALAPALIMVSIAILNAVISPILIFGLLGFPRLELQGAAIGTVIANIAGMAAGLYILAVRKKMLLPLRHLQLSLFGDSAKKILFIAVAAGLTAAITPVVNSVITGFLAGISPEAVAAFGIASRIEAFAFVLLMALAVGMGPIIGQNFGAHLFPRVHETLRKAIGFGIVWSILMAVILFVFAEHIAAAFSDDPIVIYYTALSFMIIAPSYLFNNLVNGWSSAFNAMGRPQYAFVMTTIKMLALMIPAVIIGAKTGGVTGIFIAIAAVNILSGIVFHALSLYWCRAAETKALQKVTI